MKKLWFKNKRYGYGWTPATWEGWVTMAVYFLIIISMFRGIDADSHSGSDTLIGFSLPFIVLTIVLLVIARVKGEKPEWRWGDKKDSRQK